MTRPTIKQGTSKRYLLGFHEPLYGYVETEMSDEDWSALVKDVVALQPTLYADDRGSPAPQEG